jgi:hypothetical protein
MQHPETRFLHAPKSEPVTKSVGGKEQDYSDQNDWQIELPSSYAQQNMRAQKPGRRYGPLKPHTAQSDQKSGVLLAVLARKMPG